jgi:hypothetical protein
MLSLPADTRLCGIAPKPPNGIRPNKSGPEKNKFKKLLFSFNRQFETFKF